jgi:hypothetical protein
MSMTIADVAVVERSGCAVNVESGVAAVDVDVDVDVDVESITVAVDVVVVDVDVLFGVVDDHLD